MATFEESLQVASNSIFPVGRQMPEGFKMLGTCFATNKPGFFATSLHVTDGIEAGLVVAQIPRGSFNDYQKVFNVLRGASVQIVEADPITDICILKAVGNTTLHMSIRPKGFDDIPIGEQVIVVGYPHATDNRAVLTYQEAILGAKILAEPAGIEIKAAVINLQSRPGQSGSPIFRKSNWDFLGILVGTYSLGTKNLFDGIDVTSLNQTSIAISSEYITNML